MMSTSDTDRAVRRIALSVFGVLVVFGGFSALGTSLFVPVLLLAPFVVIAGLVFLALRETAQFRAWEFLNPLFVFLAWSAAVSVFDLPKSLSNMVELPILGAASACLLWLRALSSSRVALPTRRYLALVGGVVVGVVIAVTFPGLPE